MTPARCLPQPRLRLGSLAASLLLCAITSASQLNAQQSPANPAPTQAAAPPTPQPEPTPPSPTFPITLPDAPSTALQQSVSVTATAQDSPQPTNAPGSSTILPCRHHGFDCRPPDRHQFILNSRSPDPILSPMQKLELAGTNFIDPFNLATIGLSSGISIAANSHSAYGPGMTGFGKNFGVGLAGDVTGEFFGVFAIPSIARQDPRYHRMPQGTVRQRIWHAVSRTLIGQSDHGSSMPNYSTLLTYPIANEMANLYAPGIQRDIKSTGKRVAIGYATDPVGNIIAEFLPDLASRIHVRSVFFQQILNKIATDPNMAQ